MKDQCGDLWFVIIVFTGPDLRDKEKSGRCAGDGFHVVFVVVAVVANQQVVEDPHDAHEGQEEEDALPKQVARSAAIGKKDG